MRQRLEKKPPNRSTICTTPRFLMKKKIKTHGEKEQTKATDGEQSGEKKTKTQGVKRGHKTQKEMGTKMHKKVLQESGQKSSGAKIKK